RYLLPNPVTGQAWPASAETSNLVRMRSQALGQSAPSLTASLHCSEENSLTLSHLLRRERRFKEHVPGVGALVPPPDFTFLSRSTGRLKIIVFKAEVYIRAMIVRGGGLVRRAASNNPYHLPSFPEMFNNKTNHDNDDDDSSVEQAFVRWSLDVKAPFLCENCYISEPERQYSFLYRPFTCVFESSMTSFVKFFGENIICR
ncbi:hypothetical protein STEG23_029433, partial [Scotinomys teguina]